MLERYKRRDLNSLSKRDIFFDTNILLFIFHPASGTQSHAKHWQSGYSGLLWEIIRQKNPICTNLFVLSEFFNRYLRFEASIINDGKSVKESIAFKTYRDSEIGKATQEEIVNILKNKLPRSGFSYLEQSFAHKDIIDLFEVSGLDFVDRIIVETCKKNNLVLFTDDSDFRNSDIPILSLNPNMF